MHDKPEDDAPRRPPPARPPLPPARLPEARGAPPGRAEADRRGAPRPPTPVRQAVAPVPREPPAPVEQPFRVLRADSEEWIVREAGRAAAGVGMRSRAPLTLLTFARAEAPDQPVLETLTAAGRLEELDDHQLADLLAGSRPLRPEQDRQEVFPDTRKRGGRGM